jgi:hypothetical protein
MIYRRRTRSRFPSGYYRFENHLRRSVSGYGEGDFVRLRDEYGNLWHGQAQIQDDNSLRLVFRAPNGGLVSGISDGYGIVLRDDAGATWRGYID